MKANRIPFESKLARFVNIEPKNRAFNKLNEEQQRKEIAFDALNLVIGGSLYASYGCYWDSELADKTGKLSTPKELQKFLVKDLPTCAVCQRGLMMVSTIRLADSVNPRDDAKQWGDNNTRKAFSDDSFDCMESEYENSEFNHPYNNNSEEKLANVCCNVIANGDFNVEDKTDYLKKWKIKIK